jgi:hypothetical protein
MKIGDTVYTKDIRNGFALRLGVVTHISNGYERATANDGYRVSGSFVWVDGSGPIEAGTLCTEDEAVYIGLTVRTAH